MPGGMPADYASGFLRERLLIATGNETMRSFDLLDR